MGYAARERGKPFNANPLVRPSNRDWWNTGWNTADDNIRRMQGKPSQQPLRSYNPHAPRKQRLTPRNSNFKLRGD